MNNYTASGIANAQGLARATFRQLSIGEHVTIVQVSVSTDTVAPKVPLASIVHNGQIFDATSTGNSDTASGEPPLDITSHDTLQVVWTGCDPGNHCEAIFWTDSAVS